VEAPSKLRLRVDSRCDHVIGWPAYVACLLDCADAHATLSQLPHADFHGSMGAFGLTLQRAGDRAIVHQQDPLDHADGATFDLAAGEQRRILVELNELLPPGGLPEGHYVARLSYGTRIRRSQSEPFPLHLHAPLAKADAQVAQDAPERDRLGSWALWATSEADDPGSVSLPGSAEDPLAFAKIIRFMLHGETPLQRISTDCLQTLSDFLAPEREALRAELVAVRSSAAFEEQSEMVRRLHPGLSYWMADIAAGRSEFQLERQNRGASS
jgi:hypothetical protein